MDNLIGKVEGLDSIDKLSDRIDKARESIGKLIKGIDKPTLNTTPTSNQSLGELGRLPPELRNRIYKFTLEDADEEVNIGETCRPCGPRYKLAFVSKQIYNETVGIIEALHDGPCTHRAFTLRMSAISQSFNPFMVEIGALQFSLEAATLSLGKKTGMVHDPFKRGVTYRFSSSHLGYGAPDAVIVKVPELIEQIQPDVEVLGASDGITAQELHGLESQLRGEVSMLVATTSSEAPGRISLSIYAKLATAVYHYIRLRIVASARTRREKAKEERKGMHTDEQESEQEANQQREYLKGEQRETK